MNIVLSIWLTLAILFIGLPLAGGYVTQLVRERKSGRQLELPLKTRGRNFASTGRA